jgi:hypothetical protein
VVRPLSVNGMPQTTVRVRDPRAFVLASTHGGPGTSKTEING